MRKTPLQLRIAGVLGTIGGGIGCLIGAYLGPDLYNLAVGSFLGFTAGFIIGYRFGGTIKTLGSIARAEQFASGVDTVTIILGWALVAAGLIALIMYGWNVRIILTTLFFAMGSLYLIYKRRKKSQEGHKRSGRNIQQGRK